MDSESGTVGRRTVLKSITVTAVAGVGATGVAGGTQNCDATVSDGDSIQAAIDSASADHTVCVEAGTFDEDVTVDVDGLTLEGPNAGTPGDGNRSPEALIEGQLVLEADETTADGLAVSPPPATSTQTSEAVRVSNTSDDVTVEHTLVRDFERDDPDGAFYGVDGISVFGGDGSDAIEDVTVRENKVTRLRNEDQAGAAGISVQGNVAGATVADNVVTLVGEEATAYGFGVVVRGTGNNDQLPSDVDVTGNDLDNVLSDPNSQLDGVGFEVDADGTGYLARDNRIEDNDVGIEVKVAADETTVDFNNVAGNSRRGALNRDNATLDATDNWWGHASGPGGPDGRRNPADKEVGKGDDIEGDVTFDPWLRRPIDSPSR